jgi:hypothetical protein
VGTLTLATIQHRRSGEKPSYTQSMRRILAITLLIAFGSPLIVPLLASTPDLQSNLPACCRRNGLHHCTTMAPSAAAGTPALKAPPCGNYPSPATPLRLAAAALAAPPTPSTTALQTSAPPAVTRPGVYTSVPPSNQKRGPPTLLA